MKSGNRWFGVVMALCFVFAPSLHAQSAESTPDTAKRAKVEELFTVMRLDRTMDQMLVGIRHQTESMMRGMPGFDGMTPEQKRLVDEYQGKVSALVTETVGWKALKPDMVTLYASAYSDAEIDGILSFYKSAVGQTMLDKTPELTTKSLGFTQQRTMALQPKIQELMADFATKFAAAARTGKPSSTGAKPKTGVS